MGRLIVSVVLIVALVEALTAIGFYRWGWGEGLRAGRAEIIGQYADEIAAIRSALDVDDIRADLQGRGR